MTGASAELPHSMTTTPRPDKVQPHRTTAAQYVLMAACARDGFLPLAELTQGETRTARSLEAWALVTICGGTVVLTDAGRAELAKHVD